MTWNLRDWLLSSLKTLPGTREFHLHVLVSSPRKHNGLYPFAIPRPRTYIQDIIVLLSEQPLDVDVDADQKAEGTPGGEAHRHNEKEQKEGDRGRGRGKRMLAVGIEASTYYIPSTSSGLLYISKVDTTGHGLRPSAARTLVRSLLMYYCDPATAHTHATTDTGTGAQAGDNTTTMAATAAAALGGRGGRVMGKKVKQMWVHVFARAQGQYLFPNSSEYEGKRPLSDVKLCAWWRNLLGDVAKEVVARHHPSGEERSRVGLWYVLPGYGELEAVHALGFASGAEVESGPKWTYGHPYGQRDIALPCPPPASQPPPQLPATPLGRRSRGGNLGHFIPWFDDDPKSRFMDEMAYTTETEGVTPPSPKRVRKTAQGDVSGAKSVVDERPESGGGKEGRPLGELGRVNADEFWERMSFRQECVAGAVTGFFALGIGWPTSGRESGESESGGEEGQTPVVEMGMDGEVSGQMMKRVMKMMLTGVEFSNVERAERGTETVESAIRGLCEGMRGGYEGHVYGRVVVRSGRGVDVFRREPVRAVRVLTARRKAKGSE